LSGIERRFITVNVISSGDLEVQTAHTDSMEDSTFRGIWVFGNDFLSSRSVVVTDIILFGPSTSAKQL